MRKAERVKEAEAGVALVLPSPEYYFGMAASGKSEDGKGFVFNGLDQSGRDQLADYVTTLISDYGITQPDIRGSEEELYFVFEDEGIAFVWEEQENACSMTLRFAGDFLLQDLEAHSEALKLVEQPVLEESAESVSALWSGDGTVIPAPPVVLGYGIEVVDVEYWSGHTNYEYDGTAVTDIMTYVEFLDESPYFDLIGWDGEHSYTFTYTGSAAGIEKSEKNLKIYIHHPEKEQSCFYVYEYDGFTLDEGGGTASPDGSGSEQCSSCYGDGKCFFCRGKGGEERWSPGLSPVWKDCINCDSGKCPKCKGTGYV